MNPLSALSLVDAKLAELRRSIEGADADVIRASGAYWLSRTSQPTTGNEILQFDLLTAPVTNDEHLVVLAAGVTGVITGAVQMFTFEPVAAAPGALVYGRAGVSGFSIVPWSAPLETLAQSSVAGSMNFESRGFQLVTVHGSSSLNGAAGTPPYSFVATPSIQQATPIIISPGYNLRYTLSLLPGTAAPGPGLGSYATMFALVVRERNRAPIDTSKR